MKTEKYVRKDVCKERFNHICAKIDDLKEDISDIEHNHLNGMYKQINENKLILIALALLAGINIILRFV